MGEKAGIQHVSKLGVLITSIAKGHISKLGVRNLYISILVNKNSSNFRV